MWGGMLTRILMIFILLLQGCSYKWGISKRFLPQGYRQLAIPVFKNDTQETGIEVFLTNALIRQFSLSKVAKVVSNDEAPIVIEGVIEKVKYAYESQVAGGAGTALPQMDEDTFLTTKYRIYVTAQVKLKRRSDNKIIWQGRFTKERGYTSPQIESSIINSANAIYNLSARRKGIAQIAESMMVDIHDRMTESF